VGISKGEKGVMADVLNRTAGLTAPYAKNWRQSVNTPDFDPADWIVNPDLSAVAGWPTIYWDIAGDSVLLVDAATRAARDVEIAALQDTDNRTAEKDRLADTSEEVVLRALLKAMIDEINVLRQQINESTAETNQITTTNLTPRTLAQARAAVLASIDAGV
jgi:hypothetical protein